MWGLPPAKAMEDVLGLLHGQGAADLHQLPLLELSNLRLLHATLPPPPIPYRSPTLLHSCSRHLPPPFTAPHPCPTLTLPSFTLLPLALHQPRLVEIRHHAHLPQNGLLPETLYALRPAPLHPSCSFSLTFLACSRFSYSSSIRRWWATRWAMMASSSSVSCLPSRSLKRLSVLQNPRGYSAPAPSSHIHSVHPLPLSLQSCPLQSSVSAVSIAANHFAQNPSRQLSSLSVSTLRGMEMQSLTSWWRWQQSHFGTIQQARFAAAPRHRSHEHPWSVGKGWIRGSAGRRRRSEVRGRGGEIWGLMSFAAII